MQFLSLLPHLAAPAEPQWLAHAGEHRIRLAAADDPAVLALVRERYGWRGLRVDGPGHALLTLAACEGRRVVATLGVALDGAGGLAADATFPAEVAALRRRHRLSEFTRLASAGLAPGAPVLSALCHVAWVAAHRLHAADRVLMEVHPRHVRYYQRQLGCQVLGHERPNRRVQAPAVLLAAEPDAVRQRLRALAGTGSPARHSLCARAFTAVEEDRVLCRLLLQAGGAAGGGRQDGGFRPAAVVHSLSL